MLAAQNPSQIPFLIVRPAVMEWNGESLAAPQRRRPPPFVWNRDPSSLTGGPRRVREAKGTARHRRRVSRYFGGRLAAPPRSEVIQGRAPPQLLERGRDAPEIPPSAGRDGSGAVSPPVPAMPRHPNKATPQATTRLGIYLARKGCSVNSASDFSPFLEVLEAQASAFDGETGADVLLNNIPFRSAGLRGFKNALPIEDAPTNFSEGAFFVIRHVLEVNERASPGVPAEILRGVNAAMFEPVGVWFGFDEIGIRRPKEKIEGIRIAEFDELEAVVVVGEGQAVPVAFLADEIEEAGEGAPIGFIFSPLLRNPGADDVRVAQFEVEFDDRV